MKIAAKAVDRPRVILIITALILLLTIYALTEVAIQRQPQLSQAMIVVTIPFPAADAEEVDEQITRELEEVLGQLDRVEWIQSYSFRGVSTTTILFKDGITPTEARTEVAHLVDEVRPQIPVGREIQPSITEVDFQSMPIMLVSLTGPAGYDPATMQKIGEEIQQDLESIEGVANISIFGGREREFHVNYDPRQLSQYGLSQQELLDALRQADAQLPGGTLNASHLDLQVRTDNRLRNAEDIRRVVVRNTDGNLIRIADVAEVEDTFARATSYSQLDGNPCVTVVVHKEPNINTLATANRIKERVATLQSIYPQVDLTCTRDVSAEIRDVFMVLGSSFVFGGILVALILYFTMGMRIASLVILSIPISTAISLLCLYCLNLPITTMVLLSYILVLGIVVDGAIIVVENIYRHIENGEPADEAAKRGIEEIGLPVLAADLTTIAAFLPMLMIPGILGDFVGTLPKVITLALIGSIIVDHFFIPAVAAFWLKRRHKKQAANDNSDSTVHSNSDFASEPRIGSDSARTRRKAAREKQHEVAAGFFTRCYERLLVAALRKKWLVILAGLYAFTWAGMMLGLGIIELEFFPPSDVGKFQIRYELPLGYSVDESLRAMKTVTDPLEDLWETGELAHYVAGAGPSGALLGMFASDPAEGPEFGSIMVQLKPTSQRERSQQDIIAELREKIKPIPGMKYSIFSEEESPVGGSDLELRLTGNDYKKIGQVALKLVDRLKQMQGTVDVSTDFRPANPELVVRPRPEVAALYGFSEVEVSQAVATAINGDYSIELILNDEEVPLRLQAKRDFQKYPSDIKDLVITGANGRRATVGELAEVSRELGLFQVGRHNRYAAVNVRCSVVPPEVDPEAGISVSELYKKLDKILAEEYQFQTTGDSLSFIGQLGSESEGIRARYAGAHEEMMKDFKYLAICMVLAAVLVTSVLVVQFNSVRQTAIVLIAIPLSFVGVVFGMWICDFPFSLFAFIGLISLAGIVVNDAIVIVDFANRARKSGVPIHDALVQAGRARFRPVMLTTVTTIGGMLPLFLNVSGGAEFWQPMAGAIVFGLGISTALTLIVIPVLYSLVYRGQESDSKKKSKSLSSPNILADRAITLPSS